MRAGILKYFKFKPNFKLKPDNCKFYWYKKTSLQCNYFGFFKLLFYRTNIRPTFLEWYYHCRRVFKARKDYAPFSLISLPVLFDFWSEKDDSVEYTYTNAKNISLLIEKAIAAHDKRHDEKSKDIYHKALAAIEKFHHQGGFSEKWRYYYALLNIYIRLAAIELVQKNLSKAEALYIHSMKLCMLCGMEKDENAMIELSYKLATIYAIKGDEERADLGYNFCYDEQIKKIINSSSADANDLALLGMVADGYGRFLMENGNLDKAHEFLSKAVSVGTSLFNVSSRHLIVLKNNLATLHLKKNECHKALNILLDIIKSVSSDEVYELAAVYSNLGAAYMCVGNFTDAEEACRQTAVLGRTFRDQEVQLHAENCLNKVKNFLMK